MNEYGRAWNASRQRVTALIQQCSPSDLERIAPLTPAWRVRDVVAHLVGVAQDVLAGNFPQDFDVWTSAQVERLAQTSVQDLLELWATLDVGERLSEPLAIVLYDQVTHEADLFHALGEAVAIDDDTMQLLIRFSLGRFHADANDLSVALHLDGQSWRIGDGSQPLSLTSTKFEWFRASSGRRSANQIRLMLWQGDVDVIDVLFGSRFFVPSERDVVEQSA